MPVVNFSFTVKEPQIASALRTILEKFKVENIQETFVEDDEVEIPKQLLDELNERVRNLDRASLVESDTVRKKALELCMK